MTSISTFVNSYLKLVLYFLNLIKNKSIYNCQLQLKKSQPQFKLIEYYLDFSRLYIASAIDFEH